MLKEYYNHEWSISWSGGKDSTATVILAHQHNIPIKEIIYIEMMFDDKIPATLPVMKDFVEKCIRIFTEWGITVRKVPSIKTAEELLNTKFKKSKYPDKNNKPYGANAFIRGHCKFQGIKSKTIESATRNKYQLVGFCIDELERLKRLDTYKRSLIADLGYKQIDTYTLCRNMGLLSPLYDLGFNRDGCWFCPNAKRNERQYIKTHYPHLYNEIIKMIQMIDYNYYGLETRNTWVADYLQVTK